MKLTKQIFAFVLMLSMVFSMAVLANAETFSDVPETHERHEAITELSNLGIINGYTDGTFKPEQAVTRAEMAKLIAVLFKVNDAVGESPFSDVAKDHWALFNIIAVRNLGYIEGYPDGTFKPDNEVTYQEAVAMIIRALGYGKAAKESEDPNNWATSYLEIARDLGLRKNATMITTEPAPRGMIAQLLHNALDIPVATVKKNSDGSYSTSKSDSTTKEKNDYETLNVAQVVCIPTMNLSETELTIKNGSIRLMDSEGNTYDMSVGNNTSAYNYIGRYVTVTYEKDRKNMTIKSIKDLSKTEEIDILKLKSVTDSAIEYYNSDKYTSAEKIALKDIAKNATVIYNERPLKDPTEFVKILNDAKSFVVKDSDGKVIDEALNYFGTVKISRYSSKVLINIKSYKSYYMENSVNSAGDKVYNINLKGKNEPYTINLKDTANYEIIKKDTLKKEGTVPTSISITAKSIVTLSESYDNSLGTKYIEYIVNSSKSSGKPTESSEPRGPYAGYVKIGSKNYYVTNEEAFLKMEVDSTSQYYTDASGNIVYVAMTTDGDKRFGFYSSFLSGDVEEEDSARFRFYDPETKSNFDVIVCDPEDIENIIEPGKDEGKLLWMTISNGKVKKGKIKFAEDVTVSDDANLLEDVKYHKGINVSATSNGFVLRTKTTVDENEDGIPDVDENGVQKEKIVETTLTAMSSNKVQLIRPELSKIQHTYSQLSMTSSKTVKYPNPEIYEIKKQSKSRTILVADILNQLQGTSPVYIVDEASGPTTVSGVDGSVSKISYYNLKTGEKSKAEDPLLITKDVYDKFKPKKGDIFTFYNDCDTDGVDIDKPETVFVLLRASEVAENRGSNLKFDSELIDCETQNVGKVATGFRKYSIDTTHTIGNNYYNFSLQLPLWYDSETKKLAIARTNITTNTGSTFNAYLPHDEELVEKLKAVFDEENPMMWNKESFFEIMGTDATEKTISASTKIFVYDRALEEDAEEEVLSYKSGLSAEELAELLSGISTMEDNIASSTDEITNSALKSSLIYTYFDNNTTLRTILIIK